ncbi:MAG: multidrug efflux pump subunit AcrB, partial [Saprospiraceae bacterium]
EKQDLWLLQHKQHMLDTAAIVLGQIGNVAKRKTSNSIHKEDQQYLQLLEFEYTGSGWFGSRYLNETLESFVPQLPLGFSAERDQNDFWRTTQQKQYGLIGLVMIAIFFVCTIHFESFRFAFIVITLIPMSFIGVFITFYWFDFPFDQGGYTSFLLLSGLVVNSLILILSDYSRNKKLYPHRTGTSMYLRAFRGKITPIFLTIVSTSCGLIPFAMHGAQEVFWFSLAMGTIGGLIFSLFLLFFVVPVFIKR